jgi:hypothetical protein
MEVGIMIKKTILPALAVAGVAVLALPAAASALDVHLEGITSFSGIAGASSLTAESEPIITCDSGDVEGVVLGGGTTGNINLDFTACHTTVLGITAKCHTNGSPLDNTVTTSGAFHLGTIGSSKPGVIVTPVVTTIICAGISNTITGGNVIGTITSPACGIKSASMTWRFAATGAAQEHTAFTGTTYNLTAKTGESGTVKKAGLVSTATVASATEGTLNCT